MAASDALYDTLLKGWRFLYRRGFIEGFGHISVRVPGTDQFLLCRHSLGPDAEAEDFILMDMDGRKHDGRGDPPGEYPIHLEILKAREDVNCVIHYHGMYSTAFTTSGVTLKPIHLTGTIYHEGMPVYQDPRLVSTPERGRAVARAIGSHRALLMKAHGAAVTGGSIEDAVSAAFILEENAHRAVICAQIGTPEWIDDETARDAGDELIRTRGPFRRVWSLVESEDGKA